MCASWRTFLVPARQLRPLSPLISARRTCVIAASLFATNYKALISRGPALDVIARADFPTLSARDALWYSR